MTALTERAIASPSDGELVVGAGLELVARRICVAGIDLTTGRPFDGPFSGMHVVTDPYMEPDDWYVRAAIEPCSECGAPIASIDTDRLEREPTLAELAEDFMRVRYRPGATWYVCENGHRTLHSPDPGPDA